MAALAEAIGLEYAKCKVLGKNHRKKKTKTQFTQSINLCESYAIRNKKSREDLVSGILVSPASQDSNDRIPIQILSAFAGAMNLYERGFSYMLQCTKVNFVSVHQMRWHRVRFHSHPR